MKKVLKDGTIRIAGFYEQDNELSIIKVKSRKKIN